MAKYGAYNKGKNSYNGYCCPPNGKGVILASEYARQNYLTLKQIQSLLRQGELYGMKLKNKMFVGEVNRG